MFSESSYWQGIIKRNQYLHLEIKILEKLIETKADTLAVLLEEEKLPIEITEEIDKLTSVLEGNISARKKAKEFLSKQFVTLVLKSYQRRSKGLPTKDIEDEMFRALEDTLFVPSDSGALFSEVRLHKYVKDTRRDPHYVAWFLTKVYRAALRPHTVKRDLEKVGLLPLFKSYSIDLDQIEEEAITVRLSGLNGFSDLEEKIELVEYLFNSRFDNKKWIPELVRLYKEKAVYAKKNGRELEYKDCLLKLEHVYPEESRMTVDTYAAEFIKQADKGSSTNEIQESKREITEVLPRAEKAHVELVKKLRQGDSLFINIHQRKTRVIVDESLFRNKEAEKDITGRIFEDESRYIALGDICNLEKCNTKDIEAIMNMLKHSEHPPGRTIVQVSTELSAEDISRLRKQAPKGVKFMKVDTSVLILGGKYDRELKKEER